MPTTATDPTTNTKPAETSKVVCFTSAPLIETLLTSPSSSSDEFPKLVAPTKALISYASATSVFIPVTHHHRRKQTTDKSTMTNTPSMMTMMKTTTLMMSGPKSLQKPKPPLPDALKTTKHTIILDHTSPDAKAQYVMDAGDLTRGLQ